jgi:RNA methyltransferase, TrmH family
MLSKPKVKDIQTLGQKKFRQQEKRFIAEGPKLVAELLQAVPNSFTELFALPEWILANKNHTGNIPVHEIDETDLEKISQLTTPNTVLAILKQFEYAPKPAKKGKLTLVLDDIRDPGNLGTIIRTADWFGIGEVVCSMDCAELYNPKVVQSTMGSIARVHTAYTSLETWLKENAGIGSFAAMLDGKPVGTIGKIKEGILVIGNEAQGVSPEIASLVQTKVTIPGAGGAESLNAAVAAGIILSHLC